MTEGAPGLLERKLIFVTGKGGVGKTSVAAGIAMLAAKSGKRTLVCEVDAKGNLATFLEAGPLTFSPRPVRANLVAMCMETEESLKEYLRLQLRVPLLARIGPLARTLDFIATAAPGVKEILTIGKFCYDVLESTYDLIVVDSVASGHIVGQLAAPQAINELVQVGLVRNQTSWMLDILGDPERTGVVIVSAPAEMPVSETIELRDRLRSETNVDLAAVVVNRVLPELFSASEQAIFDDLASGPGLEALSLLVGENPAPIIEGADLAVHLRRSQTRYMDRLREAIGAEAPMYFLPELFTRAHGIRVTSLIAQAIGEEVE